MTPESPVTSFRHKVEDACALAVVLVGMSVLTLLWDANGRSATRHALLTGPTRFVAYVVTRPQDCRSHLETIRTFERSDIRNHVRLGGVLLVGGGPARADAEAWLRGEFPALKVLDPGVLQRRYLREIGWSGVPLIIVLDRKAGAVRFAREAPLSIEAQRATRRALIAAILA
jgi:hypothetical protein